MKSIPSYIFSKSYGQLLFTTNKIESPVFMGFEKIECKDFIFYKARNKMRRCITKLGWQYCEIGNTNNKYILSRCFDYNQNHCYNLDFRGQGVLTYNQYAIIFPLYKLDFDKTLEVHHKVYKKRGEEKVEPWEYDESDLETLCHKCHIQVHKQSIKVIPI